MNLWAASWGVWLEASPPAGWGLSGFPAFRLSSFPSFQLSVVTRTNIGLLGVGGISDARICYFGEVRGREGRRRAFRKGRFARRRVNRLRVVRTDCGSRSTRSTIRGYAPVEDGRTNKRGSMGVFERSESRSTRGRKGGRTNK